MSSMSLQVGRGACTARSADVRRVAPAPRLHSTRLSIRRTAHERVVARSAGEVNAPSEPAPAAAEPVAPEAAQPAEAAPEPEEPETVFYEGPASNVEVAVSLLLAPTLIYAPLAFASVGKRLWVTYKITNKRLFVINTSPLFKRTLEVKFSNIKEIRSAPRAFGLWGDMVLFLRDGSRLEMTGIEKFREIQDYINRQIFTL